MRGIYLTAERLSASEELCFMYCRSALCYRTVRAVKPKLRPTPRSKQGICRVHVLHTGVQ